jgi:hypothetical protein
MSALFFVAVMSACTLGAARADEGGVSFWLPGQFSSFAAVRADPSWSLAALYYHASSDAERNKQFQRGGRTVAGLDATSNLLFLAPSYTFQEKILDGTPSLQVTGVYGHAKVDASATLTGPRGATLIGGVSDSRTSVGDLYPMAALKWNRGVHNFMAYTMADVPVGSYDRANLANIGSNHWALDAGGGYTYLDDKKGHEFSAVLGFTYNWENDDTNYKNGVDAHLDWAASQFFNEQFHAGLVGYFFQQVTGDSGAGAVLGDFKSRVYAIGPQAGYFFPVRGQKWYVNLKGYYEFDAKNRLEGWNLWVTLSIPLGPTKQ